MAAVKMPIMHICMAGRVLKHHALGITAAVMQHCQLQRHWQAHAILLQIMQ